MRLTHAVACCTFAFVGVALSCYAQLCRAPREMRASAQNLNFAEGTPYTMPPGWWRLQRPAYEAKTVPSDACRNSRQCATLYSNQDDPSRRLAFLYQVIDATQYRGKRLTYRADVRADLGLGSAARLLVRVHRLDCSTSFRDDMGDHPITSNAWSAYEIEAPVAPDARDIEFGIQLIGRGQAWINNISMTLADSAR